MKATRTLISVASLALGTFTAAGQSTAFSPPPPRPSELNESGQILIDGHSTPYLIRHLPVSSFPDLPVPVQETLNQRGCLIPQTYEAHQPENVIAARFERPGSLDWAVLCSVQGTVSLLVFFSSNPDQPFVLASAPETQRLQPHGSSGFSASIGASIPPRRIKFTRPSPALPIARRGWITMPSPIRLSTTAQSTVSMRRTPGPCLKCRNR